MTHPELNLCILPLPVLYVCQAESQLIPIMKQICLLKILEIRVFSAWWFT